MCMGVVCQLEPSSGFVFCSPVKLNIVSVFPQPKDQQASTATPGDNYTKLTSYETTVWPYYFF